MFIRTVYKKNRGSGQVYIYQQLIESVRTPRGPLANERRHPFPSIPTARQCRNSPGFLPQLGFQACRFSRAISKVMALPSSGRFRRINPTHL
jgi:hypothetical protein